MMACMEFSHLALSCPVYGIRFRVEAFCSCVVFVCELNYVDKPLV